MIKKRMYSQLFAIWAAGTLGVWATLVPESIALSTLVWIHAAGLGLLAVIAKTLVGGRPTRSVAHVLYETEQRTGR
jgi:hypothetical protein